MTTDQEPEQHQIDHWLKVAQESIVRILKNYESGHYEKKDLPIQAFYTGQGSNYPDLARAQFLNSEPPEIFRENFSKGAGYILKNFKMAYDETDPDYVGDKPPTDHSGFGYGCVSWFKVGETTFIEGVHYAFMAGNFDTARELATWYKNPEKAYLRGEKEVNRYALALKHTLLEDIESAKAELTPTIESLVKTSKDPFKLKHILLSISLYGILDNDEAAFNKGLELYLDFDQKYAQGEEKDTDYEFVCDEAVALANLGIHLPAIA